MAEAEPETPQEEPEESNLNGKSDSSSKETQPDGPEKGSTESKDKDKSDDRSESPTGLDLLTKIVETTVATPKKAAEEKPASGPAEEKTKSPRGRKRRKSPDFSHLLEEAQKSRHKKPKVKDVRPTSKTMTRSKSRAALGKEMSNFRVKLIWEIEIRMPKFHFPGFYGFSYLHRD